MPWTENTRPRHRRLGLRYASDLSDAEWALIEPFMPGRRHLGPPAPPHCVVNAIFYIAATSCQRRQLPREFPPYSTVQGYFYQWVRDGRWEIINHTLLMASREKAGDADELIGERCKVAAIILDHHVIDGRWACHLKSFNELHDALQRVIPTKEPALFAAATAMTAFDCCGSSSIRRLMPAQSTCASSLSTGAAFSAKALSC